MVKFIVFFLLLLYLNSCDNIFTLRSADDPEKGSSEEILNFTPKILMENFEDVLFSIKPAGYGSLFVDSIKQGDKYSFIPGNDFLSFFEDWDSKDEEKFARNLFESYYFKSLDLNGADLDNLSETSDDSIYVEFSYQGVLESIDKDTLTLKGNSRFLLKKYNSFWYISKWYEERSDEESENFTSLKLMF